MAEKIDIGQKQRNVFAMNFKRCLERTHKTQADVVHDLGVTSSTVSDWANAKKYPRVDKMQFLADYFGVLLSELREERPSKQNVDESSDDTKEINLSCKADLQELLDNWDAMNDAGHDKLLDYSRLLLNDPQYLACGQFDVGTGAQGA